MVQVTQIHFAGGSQHEHIAAVRWLNPEDGSAGQNTREEMVAWLRKPGSRATVSDGSRTVEVGIVEAHPPYLRTHADGAWTDNLLALPRF
ncbi:MAG TPA: DUF3892 domain-containing protein [Armatimonadota bacterium]|jgi:hypothetical protein